MKTEVASKANFDQSGFTLPLLVTVVCVAVLALAVGLALYARQREDRNVTTTTSQFVAGPKQYDWVLTGGRLTSGPSSIRVKVGDELKVNIETDGEAHLIVPGYNLHQNIDRGSVNQLNFTADQAGTYEVFAWSEDDPRFPTTDQVSAQDSANKPVIARLEVDE